MRSLRGALFLAALILAASPARSEKDEFKPEPGYTLLFNGKDLTGWKMKKGGESLDGKTETAGGRFKVKDGILVIDPSVKGDIYIETSKELAKDVHIKFEYLPDAKCNNDLFILGVKFDIKKPDVKNLEEGKWNQFEIISKDGKVEFKNNGEVQRMNPTKAEKSTLTLRAEIGGIQIRRLRAK
jgi:hypothetical protein